MISSAGSAHAEMTALDAWFLEQFTCRSSLSGHTQFTLNKFLLIKYIIDTKAFFLNPYFHSNRDTEALKYAYKDNLETYIQPMVMQYIHDILQLYRKDTDGYLIIA